MGTVLFAIAAVALLLFVAWRFVCVYSPDKTPPRFDGMGETYDRLIAEFPLRVDNDAELAQARDLIRRLRESLRQPGAAKAQEARYLKQIQEVVAAYMRHHPWHYLSDDERDDIIVRAACIASLSLQGRMLTESFDLKYAEAAQRMQAALEIALRARALVKGELRPVGGENMFSWFHFQLAGLEDRLKRAEKEAGRALFLMEAESRGEIRYVRSVGGLLKQAAETCDLELCERLLEQALQQAKNPDADMNSSDLHRALHGLGLFYQGRKNFTRAEELLLEARRQVPAFGGEYAEITGDLVRLYVDCGRLDEANAVACREVETVTNLKAINNGLHSVADGLLLQGRWDEAERTVRLSLQVMVFHERKDGAHAICAMEKLIRVLCARRKFNQAEPVYDRMIRQQSALASDTRTPTQWRIYADLLDAVGRTVEAQALYERADRQQATIAEILKRANFAPPTHEFQRRWQEKHVNTELSGLGREQ